MALRLRLRRVDLLPPLLALRADAMSVLTVEADDLMPGDRIRVHAADGSFFIATWHGHHCNVLPKTAGDPPITIDRLAHNGTERLVPHEALGACDLEYLGNGGSHAA